MGARGVLLAAALMAMVNRSMATCAPCSREKVENGTEYPVDGHWEPDYHCPTPRCRYGMHRRCCCYKCIKGPEETCGGFIGSSSWSGYCANGLVCQYPEDSFHFHAGSCVDKTTPATKCLSPWFLLNSQCLRVVSGKTEQRSSASADAYCGELTAWAHLAEPKNTYNLEALSDHLRENNFTDTYWMGIHGWYGYSTDHSSDVEDCIELLPGNGLGYGVHHLKDRSCMKKMNFICERHFFKGVNSISQTTESLPETTTWN